LNDNEGWAYDREYIFTRLFGCVDGGLDLAAHQIPLKTVAILYAT
jgi:hypothetical protein